MNKRSSSVKCEIRIIQICSGKADIILKNIRVQNAKTTTTGIAMEWLSKLALISSLILTLDPITCFPNAIVKLFLCRKKISITSLKLFKTILLNKTKHLAIKI